MKEEIEAITQRLDQMQGALLAQQVFLLAVAQDLRARDWEFLPELDSAIDKSTDQLRHANVSDLTLLAFQQKLQELRESLCSVAQGNLPF